MTQNLIKKKYIDVTIDYLKNAIPNSHTIVNSYFYISNDNIYIVDGTKKVILDYSDKELEIAIWIETIIGGEFYMNPKVNIPDGIKTADYWWNGEYWDLKMPIGSSRRTIENMIKDSKEQSKNFIIDISNSKLTINEAKYQIKNIYNNAARKWINKIILKKGSKLIAIYKRK
nr:hypothetical protein [Bacilli bacterium]